MTASETSNIAIILASGGGSRFRAEIPKQLMKVGGKTVLEHARCIPKRVVSHR
jgi:2-C-methyl-D-erythritol 4-phosphate cytidylyltransferase